MKTTTAIAVAALLAVVGLFAPASGAEPAPRLKTCDATNFPAALVWLKVEKTDCATGKEVTRRMRSYMQTHQGAGATDENGWFHHVIDGWKCRSRFVGGDEVIERCRKPISHSADSRLIKAFFYID